MNINLIYEPYIFSFFIAVFITLIYYFYEKYKDNKKELDDEEEPNNNILLKSIGLLIITYTIVMILYYSYKYISFNKISMIGGTTTLINLNNKDEKKIDEKKREKIMEKLTIVDDDIDVNILEN